MPSGGALHLEEVTVQRMMSLNVSRSPQPLTSVSTTR
jgi:hypothetical protein